MSCPPLYLALVAAAMTTGCSKQAPAPEAAAPASAASTAAAPKPQDRWLGRWTGPEGTLLDIASDGDVYALTIQSLDGPARFKGRAVGERIEFERAGKTESIRASSGQDTGMKWLLDKKNCLTIVTGEGFCRD